MTTGGHRMMHDDHYVAHEGQTFGGCFLLTCVAETRACLAEAPVCVLKTVGTQSAQAEGRVRVRDQLQYDEFYSIMYISYTYGTGTGTGMLYVICYMYSYYKNKQNSICVYGLHLLPVDSSISSYQPFYVAILPRSYSS